MERGREGGRRAPSPSGRKTVLDARDLKAPPIDSVTRPLPSRGRLQTRGPQVTGVPRLHKTAPPYVYTVALCLGP